MKEQGWSFYATVAVIFTCACNIGRLLKMREDWPINWLLNLKYKERLIELVSLSFKMTKLKCVILYDNSAA